MSMVMEAVSCNLCGQDSFDIFVVRKDLSLFIPGDFRSVRCKNCGLVYLNPRPAADSMTEIYPDEYDQYSTAPSQERSHLKRWVRRRGLHKRVQAILQYKKAGRLLDVGCATGLFLDEMRQQAGWEVQGVEISPFASAYARQQLGLEVKTGTVEDAGYPANSFDMITLWNVLEHLPDPIATLHHLHNLLKPDGLLIFNTPNLDCLDARFFGSAWAGFDFPRHFYVFSNETLNAALEKTGFRRIERRSLYGSHDSTMTSLRFWLRTKNLPANLRKNIEALLFSLPARILTAPYFYLGDRLQQSTTPTDFCIKRETPHA